MAVQPTTRLDDAAFQDCVRAELLEPLWLQARTLFSLEPTTAMPDVTLDAGDLGATYLGTFRFSDLARVGRIAEGTAGALLRADALFAAARAPWCSTMF